MKAWQKIVLGVSAGLFAAYLGAKGCNCDYGQQLVRSAQTSLSDDSDVGASDACPVCPSCPSQPDYSCVCNCPPVNYSTQQQRECPPCPDTQCPTTECPVCPDCGQQDVSQQCETVEQVINRIVANEDEYSDLIKRLVEEHPQTVIEFLPQETRSELGGQYLKGRFRDGYNYMSNGLQNLLQRGEDSMEGW
ncbi:MAG: hypothetical protein KJ574_01145 [Nanoarchaeota archaeon]|nr:hypothetical protein [Nanoarchaeota archaeon]